MQLLVNDQVRHQPVQPGARGSVNGEEVVVVDLPAGTQVLRGSVGALRDGLPVRFTRLGAPAAAKPAP